jgi:Uma2 family endonuclease
MNKLIEMELDQDGEAEEILLENVSWQTYEAILRGLGKRHVRVTYDEGDLGIMTLSEHESSGSFLGRIVEMLTFLLDIPIASGGMTTLRKKWRKKGLEPDKSYWIQHERRMRGRKRWLPRRDPPPDLVIEIEISRSALNRMAIYAALGVPEIWTFDGQRLAIFQLDRANEKYREKTNSRSFQFLTAADIQPFLDQIGMEDETRWLRRFAEWVKTELLPRYQAGQATAKNGKKQRNKP